MHIKGGELIEEQILTKSVGYITSSEIIVGFDEKTGMIKIRAVISKNAVQADAVVLKNIDNSSKMYTFNHEGEKALNVIDNLFSNIKVMNLINEFQILFLNGDSQVIDNTQRIFSDNNTYFVLGKDRMITPDFRGMNSYNYNGNIDMDHLKDFSALNIVKYSPTVESYIDAANQGDITARCNLG
ncbi:MAG: hypothetical protein LBH05_05775 [Deferribacteraceae bacterium]|jgi:hypothetical protein|nr:hypothetical protein [Deferribacteraceae bacterium]